MCLSKNGNIKGVFFDLDGVVLDSMSAHARSWQLAFRERGIDLETEFFLRHEGNLDWEIIERMPQFDGRLKVDDFIRLLEKQREIYLTRFADSVSVYPQAPGILAHLRRTGYELALVTSSIERILIPEVKGLIAQYFRYLVTGDQVTKSKPHPEPYLKALDAMNLEPSSAIVIENAPAGIESAKSAGITCLALATTLPPEILHRADMVFAGHDELSEWFCG